MNAVGAIACGLCAADCMLKALGMDEQTILASGNLWLWWPAAFGWAASGFVLATE